MSLWLMLILLLFGPGDIVVKTDDGTPPPLPPPKT